MYNSKHEIEQKLNQVKYAWVQFKRYEGRIFVDGGRDPKTGSFPLINDLSSFITQARSVFQYAYKEANERGLLSSYDDFVNSHPIINCFKVLRDSDIHEYIPGTATTIKAHSPIEEIDRETGTSVGKPLKLYVEDLDDLDEPKDRNSDAKVTITITNTKSYNIVTN